MSSFSAMLSPSSSSDCSFWFRQSMLAREDLSVKQSRAVSTQILNTPSPEGTCSRNLS